MTPRSGSTPTLRDYYRRDWRRLSLSTGFHLAGWLLGAVEAYLILIFLGIPADLVTATVIEALGAGVRFATFLVPASLGAFESANAAAFEAMGLGAGAGLAFSFVRRARQLVWTGIGLLVLVSMGWLAKRGELQDTVSTGTSSSQLDLTALERARPRRGAGAVAARAARPAASRGPPSLPTTTVRPR